MRQRSPASVVILSIITFLIYWIVWLVNTKDEMNELGANIPSAWYLLIPVVNVWWGWKWSEGCEIVTGGKLSASVAFVLHALLLPIGSGIIQVTFNGLPADAR